MSSWQYWLALQSERHTIDEQNFLIIRQVEEQLEASSRHETSLTQVCQQFNRLRPFLSVEETDRLQPKKIYTDSRTDTRLASASQHKFRGMIMHCRIGKHLYRITAETKQTSHGELLANLVIVYLVGYWLICLLLYNLGMQYKMDEYDHGVTRISPGQTIL